MPELEVEVEKELLTSPSTPPSPTSTREQSDAWMDSPGTIYDEIHAERVRAHAKHGDASMESSPPDDPTGRRYRILSEEVGEVAREFNDAEIEGRSVDLGLLIEELIQVAAMAAAWAEACERPVSVAAARVAPVEAVGELRPVEEIRADLAGLRRTIPYVRRQVPQGATGATIQVLAGATRLAADVDSLLAERDEVGLVESLERVTVARDAFMVERNEARAALGKVYDALTMGGQNAASRCRAALAVFAAAGVPEPPQEPQPERHEPYNDDGVTYCGWIAGRRVVNGCGHVWPCPTVKMRDAALPVGERINAANGDELEHGTDSEATP